MKPLVLKAFAKLNLGLAIVGRRPDGYHELRTIYQTIALSDFLEVNVTSGSLQVHLETVGLETPAGKQNLVVRAVEALCRELSLRVRVSIILRKRIPPRSGLGGASSDAAAALRAVLCLTGKRLAADRLFHLASELGSDVPFFLFGGKALGVGRGEEIYPLPEPPRRYCVVLVPSVGIDTAEAYRMLRMPRLTSPRMRHTIELFCGKVNETAGSQLENDFEEKVFAQIPQLVKVKKTLLRCGAVMASLSGSGSAVFGLFRDFSAARQAARLLRKPGQTVFLTRTISRREYQAAFPRS